ncbi:MAG: outer membrane lipoprotein carrier protein LolA [Myxococcota bacterium]|nr:outer membrane lipoprotein carrier protein LolA [Myxococcota bacterium]
MMTIKRHAVLVLFLLAPITYPSVTSAASKSGSPPSQLTADFSLTRTLSVLSDTIASSGTLTLGGPGLLRWKTTSPSRSILVINRHVAWIHYPDLGITKNFEISRDPVMGVLSKHLLALTSGDVDSIARYYRLMNASKTKKHLVPLEPEVKQVFREMYVTMGADGVATRVELISSNGDISVIVFSNIRINPRIPRELFENPEKYQRSQ